MRIIRYSKNGFVPQHQTHHLRDVFYHLNEFDINEFPEHLRYHIQERHNKLVPFYHENYVYLQYGVWAFIDGYKNNESLNHLRELVPCWEAEIPDDTVVFDVNWERTIPITDGLCRSFGFFIPEQQMHSISGIQRRIR
jgi:hypothetical protein